MFNANGYVSEMKSRENFRTCVRHLAEDIPAVMRTLGAEAIAVRGKSGVAVAHALALLIDIDIAVIRKPGENSHGSLHEGWGMVRNTEHFNYLIIDDFISTGETAQQIIGSMVPHTCVGMVCYQDSASDWVLEVRGSLRDRVGYGWNPCPMYRQLPAVPVFCYVPRPQE